MVYEYDYERKFVYQFSDRLQHRMLALVTFLSSFFVRNMKQEGEAADENCNSAIEDESLLSVIFI